MHVIVGNGIAGLTAAQVIRKFGHDIDVAIVSEEKHPAYSPCVFPNYISGEIRRDRVFLNSHEDYLKMGIHPIFGKRVLGIYTDEKNLLLEDGNLLQYDKLVIATGSEPMIPGIDGVEKKGVFALKTLKDVDGFLAYPKRKIAILGAGFIGVETAMALRIRSYDVTLIESSDRVLPAAFDEGPARIIETALRERGVKILTGEEVTKILGDDEARGVEVGGREIGCDAVVLATGMKPRVELAKGAGIKIGELGGILTDERMSTSVEGIYACGDCTESRDVVTGRSTLNLIWPNAVLQGWVAGNNCVGILKKYRGFVNIVGMDLFGTHVVSIGHTLATIGNGGCEEVEKARGTYYSRIIFKDGMIVGAQFIGGTEKIGAIFGAIWKKARTEDIKKVLSERELLVLNPWYMGIRQYL
jgi:NADH oxidase (H2O2-forming)